MSKATRSNPPASPAGHYVAKTFQGLEGLLASELRDLGATHVVELKRAVEFSGSVEILYKANLHARTALRILRPLASFRATNEHALYRNIQKIDWSQWLTPGGTLAVDSTVHSRIFKHSKYVALKTKDAVVDQIRTRMGERPSVDVLDPDVRLHVHISEDACILSADSSGQSLHRRGYREEATEAPINEILAAALVLHSGWNGDGTFIDPMCGSGTIAIEAAMIGKRFAPGLLRQNFGFMKWPDFDASVWSSVRRAAQTQISAGAAVWACDKDAWAVELTRRNVRKAGMESAVLVRQTPFEQLEGPSGPSTVVMNPPYGERLHEADIHALYKTIGDTLKKRFAGSHAWIISSNQEALKHVGLRASRKIILFNGALKCTLAGYELYEGRRDAGGKAATQAAE